jgi:radical SAM protein with 4Fe4S-binding SPASM domain
MKLFSSSKILSYYTDAQTLYEGGMVAPRMALLYLTYACNYKCPHCLYKGWNKGHHYSTKKLYRLLDQLWEYGVKAIEFCGGGEPTLHPDFIDIVRYSKRLGFELGLFTNGSTLKHSGSVISNNFAYVRISLDTADPEEYKELHGLKQFDFDNYLRWIKELVDHRNINQTKCHIGLKALLTNRGMFLEELVNLKEKLGADYIQFKSVRNCESEPTPEQVAVYKCKIAEYKDGSIKDGLDQSRIDRKCFLTPIHTMIDAFGDVYLCCYYQHRDKSHKIGNVLNNSFKSVWESQRHKEAIAGIKQSECNCYDCRFHGYNSVMEGVLQRNDYHINFI